MQRGVREGAPTSKDATRDVGRSSGARFLHRLKQPRSGCCRLRAGHSTLDYVGHNVKHLHSCGIRRVRGGWKCSSGKVGRRRQREWSGVESADYVEPRRSPPAERVVQELRIFQDLLPHFGACAFLASVRAKTDQSRESRV